MTDNFTVSTIFLNATSLLTPKTAVAAIIMHEDGRVLLQLRDDKEEIFFPHHWGCFGGAIDGEESPEDALFRELREELSLVFTQANVRKFININFNVKADSPKMIDRYFFVVQLSSALTHDIKLEEGAAFQFFTRDEVMCLTNITPYDKFALWLYFNQNRIL